MLTLINYVVVSEEFSIACYIGYREYSDILRYYNVNDLLHRHVVVKDHLTLTLL